jgi:hypothetical protein
MILSLMQWVQNTGLFTNLRASAYAYPIVLALHLTFISLGTEKDPRDSRHQCVAHTETHRIPVGGDVRNPSVLLQGGAILLQRLFSDQAAPLCDGCRSCAGFPEGVSRGNGKRGIKQASQCLPFSLDLGRHPHGRKKHWIRSTSAGSSYVAAGAAPGITPLRGPI